MTLSPLPSDLSQDHQLMLESVRAFAADKLFPLDRKWDENESSVAEILPQLGEMGLLHLMGSEEVNGLGLPYRVYASIIHEIAMWSPSVAVTIAVHNMVGGILSKGMAEPLRSRYLSGWSAPENLAAFCLTEAGAGSDARATKTSARPVKGGFIVDGEKMWITNGMTARWFLTLVRLEGAAEEEDLCAVLIDGQSEGLTRHPIHGKMGIRGSETSVIHLHQVFVPEDHLIGARGEGLNVFLATLNQGRIGIAAQATGIAEACLIEMVSYARQREQFGRPIGKFQAVGEMIASSYAELESAKTLTWHAAYKVDQEIEDRMASSMAKLYASEAANRIAYRAVQVHGGAGFVRECRVEQLYRDARVTTIYEGTSETQRIVIAKQLSKT